MADVLSITEKVSLFHDFLMGGEAPGGITTYHRPAAMTAEESFTVIYVIQEFLRVLPDTIELCGECHCVYDTVEEGHISEDDLFFCGDCCFLCECERCAPEGE